MANDDKGHSINDDLCMMGLPGDDEEDLGADREALFGCAASPINLAAGGACTDPDTVTTSAKRKRQCTSDV